MKPFISKLICLLAAASVPAGAVAAPLKAPPQPRLVVVISVDQFSGNLFEQYRSRFTGGLKTLADQGVVFPNGYQSHAATETCPGHSTLLTGRHPSATGVIANNWHDRTTGKDMYCVFDPAYPVPGREGEGRGPANLKVSTLGEWMKQANPAARAFGVSGKDRAAIMMTGHNPDGVFWWDDGNGFTTSVPAGTTAEARLAPVAGFNQSLFSHWQKVPPRWQLRDKRCAALGGPHSYGAITIDHKVPPAAFAPKKDIRTDPAALKALRASPVMDRITLDAATSLIGRFRLGRGSAPDLLAVSLSATDYIGHSYGNQGPEMCDQMAHLDEMLGAFLKRLEGLKLPVLVVLTADHGGLDAPERVAERAIPAERVAGGDLVKALNASVRAKLGLAADPLGGDIDQLYLIPGTEDAASQRWIIDAALAFLKARPEVAAVYNADEIAASPPAPPGTPPDELTLLQRLSESFEPARSGDIAVVLQPYASAYAPKKPGSAIAGHGSPWNYDRRVPILFWWPGAAGFEQSLPVETVDIAPTLAAILRVPAPQVDGRCLDLDRTPANSCAPAGN